MNRKLNVAALVLACISLCFALLLMVFAISLWTRYSRYIAIALFQIVGFVMSVLSVVFLSVGFANRKGLIITAAVLLIVHAAVELVCFVGFYGGLLGTSSIFCILTVMLNIAAAVLAIVTAVSKEKAPAPAPQAVVNAPVVNDADKFEKLREAKELFDMGAITREEFDGMKAKILGN